MKIPGKRESRRTRPAEAPAARGDVPAQAGGPAPATPSLAAATPSPAVAPPSAVPVAPVSSRSVPLRWILVTGIVVAGGVLGYRSLRATAPSVETAEPAKTVPLPPTGTKHPRERRPLKEPALPGDAFQHYYELAAVALDVKKDQERALHAWARNPATGLPAPVASAQRTNGRALLLLEQGAKAERADGDRRLNATLAQKALVLGRLELARGRLELQGGTRFAAFERAVCVVRFAQDVIGSDTPEAAFAGTALENDAVTALESWLEQPGWTSDELKAVRDVLPRVLESSGAPPRSEDAARVLERAHGRLLALLKVLDRMERSLKEGKTP